VEPNAVTIKTNRLSWESNYSSMTSDGKLTCRNIVATNGTFTGNLESQTFYANGSAVGFGDFYVSANGSNLLRSNNNWFRVNSQGPPAGSPGGDYASLYIGGQMYSGVNIKGTGVIETSSINCKDDIFFPNDSWSGGWGVLRMLKDLYNRVGN